MSVVVVRTIRLEGVEPPGPDLKPTRHGCGSSGPNSLVVVKYRFLNIVSRVTDSYCPCMTSMVNVTVFTTMSMATIIVETVKMRMIGVS